MKSGVSTRPPKKEPSFKMQRIERIVPAFDRGFRVFRHTLAFVFGPFTESNQREVAAWVKRELDRIRSEQ